MRNNCCYVLICFSLKKNPKPCECLRVAPVPHCPTLSLPRLSIACVHNCSFAAYHAFSPVLHEFFTAHLLGYLHKLIGSLLTFAKAQVRLLGSKSGFQGNPQQCSGREKGICLSAQHSYQRERAAARIPRRRGWSEQSPEVWKPAVEVCAMWHPTERTTPGLLWELCLTVMSQEWSSVYLLCEEHGEESWEGSEVYIIQLHRWIGMHMIR